jgi:EAL domain-containing protein (putative c-di-GMP-specific phosphodiesterase class I)/CheY-like chemotaxis protein/HPt (histidine-containing phosphotransfer) domain-containing protein
MTLSTLSRQPAVLLVDDDPIMLSAQSHMLRSMGYEHVASVGNAQAAYDLLNSHRALGQPIDIIICDLNMPEIDGIEFLQMLNAANFVCGVILLSGEGARIMHTVQKLLSGRGLRILGALKKPANHTSVQALLDCWEPDHVADAPGPRLNITRAEIERASRDRQWLLHYQPKVSLETGALVGMEALVRWSHPVHGLVYPDNFISVAEQYGVVDGLTDWVLREATEQLARWNARGQRIQIAVNVSMDNLRAPDFAQRAAAIVREAGVSPQDVTLEITESRAMSPTPAPLESLVRLRLLRFKLSIDDFGTGHSSLAQLRDVPFTELKIDKGFVHGARRNQIIRPMLDGSLGIAKRLGMVSVAEGVETAEDWQLLREIECDIAQGYYIGYSMPSNRVDDWLIDWNKRSRALVGSADTLEPASATVNPLGCLPGIDVATWRASGMGNDELYRRLLKMFLEQQQDFPERFLAASTEGDFTTAMRLAHSLKSVAGTLGAHGVEHAVEALEKGCNGGAGMPGLVALLDDVARHLTPVMSGLRTLAC